MQDTQVPITATKEIQNNLLSHMTKQTDFLLNRHYFFHRAHTSTVIKDV